MIKRDQELFPEDETGDNLWHLLNQGCDLNQITEIEFSMIFPSQQQALAFAQVLLENNQKISFTPYDIHDTHNWEITAYPSMPLNYQTITGYQALLVSHAEQEDGLFDGWYCSEVADYFPDAGVN